MIAAPLWESIRTTYEAGNYSHAVVDAIRYMSETLRTRAGVDGDGATLVGQALGGDAPKLRLNKLQSQSDKDEQKGFEQLLRGLYLGIRNPRVHDQGRSPDTREQADAMILFINLLCAKISESQTPFTVAEFIKSVIDPNFVRNRAYAKLLVSEVPNAKRYDTLWALFKSSGGPDNVGLVSRELIQALTDDERRSFYAAISQELRASNDAVVLFRTFQVIQPEWWDEINEIARARTEGRIRKHLEAATSDVNGNTNEDGALITWAVDYFKAFAKPNRAHLAYAIADKLRSADDGHRQIVASYLIGALPDLADNDAIRKIMARALATATASGSSHFVKELTSNIGLLADWKEVLVSAFESLRPSYPELLDAIDHVDEMQF